MKNPHHVAVLVGSLRLGLRGFRGLSNGVGFFGHVVHFRKNQPAGPPDWTGLMAGTFISIIPVFMLLVFFGRQVVESLQFSGGK